LSGDESKRMYARASSASGLTLSQTPHKISDKEARSRKTNYRDQNINIKWKKLNLVLDLYTRSQLHPKSINIINSYQDFS
jgi:hypothetical protein